MASRPWSRTADGIVLAIRLKPKSTRDAIEGIAATAGGQAALVVRVRAMPVGGDANVALVRLIAKTLDIPARNVTLAAGATSRLKRLAISGDGPTLMTALEKIVPPR